MRVGRRSVTLLAATSLLSALALAAVATGAANATVTIEDTGIAPPTATIDAGGKITWTNAGKKPHAVASLDSAFAAFALLPGSSRSVTFKKPDCYAYTVDGRFSGTVRVGGATCGGGSGGPPGGKPKAIAYDILLEGHAERTETAADEPDADANGKRVLSTDWTMSWKKLRYSVRDFGSSVIVLPVRIADVKKGALIVESSFSETRNSRIFGNDCRGKVVYPQYRAALFVNTTIRPVLWTLQAGRPEAHSSRTTTGRPWASRRPPATGASSATPSGDHRSRRRSRASRSTSPSSPSCSPCRRRVGAEPAGLPPIANLVAGRSFSIPTRTFELLKNGVCGAPAVCTEKLRTSLKITFTARR